MTVIRGLSWSHTRGHAPLVTTGAAWTDRHPDVELEWSPRSLREFAGGALDEYIGSFDLVALDYPLIGEAAEQGWLTPLNEVISSEDLDVIRGDTIGECFDGYVYDKRVWALPLDAAAQSCAYRADLLPNLASRLPSTFAELVELARSSGAVAVPLSVFSVAATFFSLCASADGCLFVDGLIDREVGLTALERLRELAAHVSEQCFAEGAVQVLSRAASTDQIAYVGYVYGYALYAREGYFPRQLTYTELPSLSGAPSRATLGGVGLGLLASAPQSDAALDYARWVTSPECQGGLFAASGGQPTASVAWSDTALDRAFGGFYAATREMTGNAYRRPNAPWFGRYQVSLGLALQDFLRDRSCPAATTLARLESELSAAVRDAP
jgi:multiple sugar transport system substrate-binding protein